MAVQRVLVFGETGSGKTSLCNCLSNEDHPTDSSANGVTFSTQVYKPISINENEVIFTDTVGLNESSRGTVSAKNSIENLTDLILSSKEGFHLAIHVMRMPRITESHVKNYEFFVQKLLGDDVPCILVATGCENEEPMQGWVTKNRPIFEAQECLYSDYIAACFAKNGPLEVVYAPRREQSKNALADSIQRTSLSEAKPLYGSRKEFQTLLLRTWNTLCDWFSLDKYRAEVNDTAYDVLIKLGVSESNARKITEVDLIDLAKYAGKEVIKRKFSK